MPTIKLITEIKANKKIVFDLSRSIDFHKISTNKTNEKAVDGVKTGLIGHGEYVTWKAKHFGKYQHLTSKITEFDEPNYFVDEMVKGIFKKIRHEHHFEETKYGTKMTDVFVYKSPLLFLGKLVDFLFLKKYLSNFLKSRNQLIKEYAETEKWKEIIKTK